MRYRPCLLPFSISAITDLVAEIRYNRHEESETAMIIENTDDFIRALRQNREFRAAARRELLTQELLELPRRFAEYTAVTDKRLDTLTSDVSVLKADVAELKVDVSELKTDVAELKVDVAELKVDVSVLKTDVAALKGFTFESRLQAAGLPQMVREFGLRRTRIVKLAEDNRVSEEFNSAVWKAEDEGIISEAEYNRLTVTDMIVRSRMRRDSEAVAYVIAEASYSIDEDDIGKVGLSAEVVRRVFPDARIFTALYGVNISEESLVSASNKGIKVFLEEIG